MSGLLEGKVALITGAGHPRGIGRAILNALSAEGAITTATDLAGAEGLGEIQGIARSRL